MKRDGDANGEQSNDERRIRSAASARTPHGRGQAFRTRGCSARKDGGASDTTGGSPVSAAKAAGVCVVVLSAGQVPGAPRLEQVVSYCDVCRRWGERGSEHVCGQNWSEHLLPVLAAFLGKSS